MGDANRIYGIGTDSAIYRWTGTAWTRVSGWGRAISAASDGTVAAIAANRFWSMGVDGNVYRYDGNANWNQLGTAISDIAASAEGAISVVNKTTQEIWRKTSDDNTGNWAKAAGQSLQLAATSARWLVVVGTDRNLYRFAPNG